MERQTLPQILGHVLEMRIGKIRRFNDILSNIARASVGAAVRLSVTPPRHRL
jgi:hypothetical protein